MIVLLLDFWFCAPVIRGKENWQAHRPSTVNVVVLLLCCRDHDCPVWLAHSLCVPSGPSSTSASDAQDVQLLVLGGAPATAAAKHTTWRSWLPGWSLAGS
jgi:hypothetical protein